MEVRPLECMPTINGHKFSSTSRSSRREDALRRLFSIPPSPEAKAEIARRFRDLRKKTLLTQTHLGLFIGLCRQSVNAIENRRVWPHYTTLERFADFEAKLPTNRVPTHWALGFRSRK